MKMLFSFIGFAFGFQATAGTQIFFARDNSKVTVTMLAMTANPDAHAYYDALHVKVEDANGKATKKFKFKDADGVESLSVVCAFSKLVGTTGSCVSVFKPSKGLAMDRANSKFVYKVEGVDALALSEYFEAPREGTQIYKSSDDHFVVSYAKNEDGNLSSMTLEYK